MGANITFYMFTIHGHIDCTMRSQCVSMWESRHYGTQKDELFTFEGLITVTIM